MRWVLKIAAAMLVLTLPASAQAPRRVALVFANADYQSYRDLPNAAVDAGLVEASLRRAQFDVEIWRNQSTAAMRARLAAFQQKANGADLALVYFAGHGMEVGGKNFLVPTDVYIEADNELRIKAVEADLIIDVLSSARARIVVLDACRNNPLANQMRQTVPSRVTRAVGSSGLGQQDVQSVRGTLLMYSAGPNQLADDGPEGQGSPFARAFARWLPEPGMELRLAIGAISTQVYEETRGQLPFSTTSLGQEPVYLVAGARVRDPEAERELREAREQIAALQKEKSAGWGAGTAPLPGPPASSRPASTTTTGRLEAGGPGSVFRDCAECPEMVAVPAGSFTMGDNASGESDERPERTVSIRAFAAGRHELTLGEWKTFVNATGRANPPNDCYRTGGQDASWRAVGFAQDDRHPVACVNWTDAQDYLRWLSQRTGQRYRLMTEAEWEYAARAGTRSVYWWGDNASHEQANYGADACCSGLASGRDRWTNTAPVGSFPANAFGLSDMHGNVWEWVQDCYANTYAGAPTDSSAFETNNCSNRVFRGGSWLSSPSNLRSAIRYWNTPTYRYNGVGFRLARTL